MGQLAGSPCGRQGRVGVGKTGELNTDYNKL